LEPKRRIGTAELAELFGFTRRTLRRLQNDQKQILPTHKCGSIRVDHYELAELVRFSANRLRAGKTYKHETAQRLGCLPLLETVQRCLAQKDAAENPEAYTQLRFELQLELLTAGDQSPLLATLGVQPFELPDLLAGAKTNLARILATPGARERLVRAFGDALMQAAMTAPDKSRDGVAETLAGTGIRLPAVNPAAAKEPSKASPQRPQQAA